MLNERLERIYKDGINNYIVPMSTLNLEENPTIVFDIESCGLENNTKALTYSIAAMSATNDSDIMYWGNSVKEFMDLLLNSSFSEVTVYAHNLFFDIKPFLTYFLNNYPANMLKNEIEEEKIYDYELQQTVIKRVQQTTAVRKEYNEFDYDFIYRNGILYMLRIYGKKQATGKSSVITFKDSFKIAPYSLQKCAKDFLGLKLSKGGLDYEKERSLDDELTLEELKYIYEDVYSLSYLIKQLIINGVDMNGKKVIYDCLTNSAQSLKNYKETLLDDFNNSKNAFENEDIREEIDNILMLNKFYECKDDTQKANKVFRALFPELNIGLDHYLRHSYYGGLSMVDFKNVEKFSKLDNHNGVVLDVNSLYPFTMLEYTLPYGKCIVKQKPYKDLSDSFKKQYPLYIQEIIIHDMKLKDGKTAFVQIKDTIDFDGKEVIEENINNKGEKVSIRLLYCNPLLELLFENYELKSYELKRCFCFKGTKKLFQNYIDFWSRIKQENTGSLRAIAKLRQNGLYGKFGTSSKCELFNLNADNDKFSIDYTHIEYATDSVYLPMASFITSYAKAYLVRAINNNRERFLYCDTDSLHLYGTLDEVKGVKIGKKIYGFWDNELCFDDFKYLGSKRYAEHNKETGEWEIKCCGLTDKIMKQVDVNYFDYCNYTVKELNKMKLYTKDDDVYYYEDKECTKVIKGLFKSKKARIVSGGTLIITTPYAIIK